MARGRMHKRFGKRRRHHDNPSPKRNPPLLTDVAEFILPGFAGFAATRFLTRIAATQIEKRKPSWGKHAGALASLASFFSAWFLAHRSKFLEKYHTPLVVGSGIAALQSIIQLYIPRVGWMVSDATPEMLETAVDPTQVASGNGVTPAQLTAAGFNLTDDDPQDYQYNDSYDAGIFSKNGNGHHHQRPPVSSSGAPQQSPPATTDDDDILSELDASTPQGAGVGGVFSGGFGN